MKLFTSLLLLSLFCARVNSKENTLFHKFHSGSGLIALIEGHSSHNNFKSHPVAFKVSDSVVKKSKTDHSNAKKGDSISPIVRLIDHEVGRYLRTVGLFIQIHQDKDERSNGSPGSTGQLAYQSKSAPKIPPPYLKLPANSPDSVLTRGKEVFGFHPYWMGNTYESYDYDLLTSIAFFSYELNPVSGNYLGYEQMNNWRKTPLVNRAQNQGCKVYLTVTCFKASDHRVFLNNTTARSNSIRIISDLLSKRNANGVVINFEEIPEDLRDKFTTYIIELSKALEPQGQSVIITLPPVPDRAFNSAVLKDHVRSFIIMGKNYYVKNSSVAGPVSPLRSGSMWQNGSLETTINEYLKSGIPRDKFILSLPFYGSKWKTADGSVPAKNLKFNDFLKYQTIKNKYPIQPNYDTVSQSAYLNVYENGEHFQIWFDDAKTISKKFDFIIEKNLSGVGIWALGYDNGYTDLKEALRASFARDSGERGIDEAQAGAVLPQWIISLKNYHVLKALLYFLMLIFGLGALLSLRSIGIREILFRRRWIKYLVIVGVPAIILFSIFQLSNSKNAVIIFIGLLLGYLIYFIVNRNEDLDNNVNRVS